MPCTFFASNFSRRAGKSSERSVLFEPTAVAAKVIEAALRAQKK
jgi:hypothetical protein